MGSRSGNAPANEGNENIFFWHNKHIRIQEFNVPTLLRVLPHTYIQLLGIHSLLRGFVTFMQILFKMSYLHCNSANHIIGFVFGFSTTSTLQLWERTFSFREYLDNEIVCEHVKLGDCISKLIILLYYFAQRYYQQSVNTAKFLTFQKTSKSTMYKVIKFLAPHKQWLKSIK